MVFTNSHIIAFYEDNDQMSLTRMMRIQLQAEGLENVLYLSEFDEAAIKGITENLRRPWGRTPDPDPITAEGATIRQLPFQFGANSMMRLVGASNIVHYYEAVGREITPSNMKWTTTIKSFVQHWKVLEERKKENDNPEDPKITKNLAVTKWSDEFQDFLARVIGGRKIPLSYVIRELGEVPDVAPSLAPYPGGGVYSYSTEHGSVEDELIARGSHAHPLFCNDNAEVYHYLEEEIRGTSYYASIKPSQRKKDGQKVWTAMISQYACKDKWTKELKECDELINSRKWTSTSNFTLEWFISQHRNAFVSMNQCTEHVYYQLPNEPTRVTYLLDKIENNDPALQALIALV